MAAKSLLAEGMAGPRTHPPALFMADDHSLMMLKEDEGSSIPSSLRDSSDDQVPFITGSEEELKFGSFVWMRARKAVRPMVARLMKRVKVEQCSEDGKMPAEKCWISECAASNLPCHVFPAQVMIFPNGCSRDKIAVAKRISVCLTFESSKDLRMDVECKLKPVCVMPVVRSAFTGKVGTVDAASFQVLK